MNASQQLPPPLTERPPKAYPNGQSSNRIEHAAQVTAEALGTGVKTVAKAASQYSPRQYLVIVLRILGLIGMFVVYQTIEAEGLREIFGDIVSKRLSKASALFLGWMANFEETRRLDMANALAFAFLLATYASWEAVIYRLVARPEGESGAERYLVIVPAVVLMVIDTILFAAGVFANGSFTTPLPAVMLAVGYDAMLILFSLWLVKLQRRKQ